MQAADESSATIRQLAHVMIDFLMEIDGYRQMCIRHDRNTMVTHTKNRTLWLRKEYKWNKELQELVTRTLSALDDWEESPWNSDQDDWNRMKKRVEEQEQLIASKGTHRKGWPVLVTVQIKEDNIIVSTASPFVDHIHQPELPIRKAAMALECHEHLVPEYFAKPRCVQPNKNNCYSLHSYLKNTMQDRDDPIAAMLEKWPVEAKKTEK